MYAVDKLTRLQTFSFVNVWLYFFCIASRPWTKTSK